MSTVINLNDGTPAAPAGKTSVKWQAAAVPALLTISAVASSGGLFKITTSAAHALTTDDSVFVQGGSFSTLTGEYKVTVVDSTSFTLQGSVYAAGWVSGGSVLAARNVSAYLPLLVGDSGSGGTAGAVPAPAAGDAAAHKVLKADGAWEALAESDLALTDITTHNVSISKHGLAPKAPNDATRFLDGTGAYSTPAVGPIAESDVTGLTADLAAKADDSRLINTTAPLTGGGDLSADLTLAIDAFTGDSGSGGAKGAVPAPAAGDAAAGKFIKADGTWAVPPGTSPGTVSHTAGALTADQPVFGAGAGDTKVGTKSGDTNEVVTQSGSATAGRVLLYDANGNAIASTVQGNSTLVQMASGSPTTGRPLIYDANGNAVVGTPLAQTLASVSHKFLISYDAATGLFVAAQPAESDLSVTDITTNDVSTSAHGFAPKLPNDATKFLNGVGAYAVPSAGGGGITYGTLASLPGTPAASGTLYVCTDSPYDFLSNGSVWLAYVNSQPVTQPILANFTWANQGTSTSDITKGGIYITAPAVAGDNIRFLSIATPSTPYTITAGMLVSATSNNPYFGIGWSDGTKYAVLIVGGLAISVTKYTNVTTFSAQYTASAGANLTNLLWLRITDDGTNRIAYISTNGQFWIQFHSVARTDFLTPTRVGFLCSSQSATWPSGTWLLHWAQS
jgi:hypothetical protein